MKIYTKTGDSGTTSLVGGTRVSKCHPRVEAYGDADELISHLGVIKAMIAIPPADPDGILRAELRSIQEFLMQASAHLAADREVARLKPLDEAQISALEASIDKMTSALPPQTTFLLPGVPVASSFCHIARTVCRRTERRIVAIGDLNPQESIAAKYINRLSDYLFTLARYLCVANGHKEEKWIP
ncbi:MAG: cob(I)yrinic acid a,c-diamide adenosyltransferase [Bacteroidales bacterium]|nr:cob(I)yrinic acid a,c-diamide adenosyltransferase [Bacteroidales bacterium]